MLCCMLDHPSREGHIKELEADFFEKYLLPMHLKEKKYLRMAVEENLSFDELIEVIYENEYESYLQGGE